MIQDIKLSHLIHQLNIQSIKVVNKNLFTLRLRVLSIIWNRNRELTLHNHIFFYSLLLQFKSRIFLNTSLDYLKKSTHQNFACHQLNKVKIWACESTERLFIWNWIYLVSAKRSQCEASISLQTVGDRIRHKRVLYKRRLL